MKQVKLVITLVFFTIGSLYSQSSYNQKSNLCDTCNLSGPRWGNAVTLPGQYHAGTDTNFVIFYRDTFGGGIGYGIAVKGDTSLYFLDYDSTAMDWVVKWRSSTFLDINKQFQVGALGNTTFGVRLPKTINAASLATDANGKIIAGSLPTPIAIYHLTYAQASDTVSKGKVVPNAWYHITNKDIYIQGVTDSTYSLNGYYVDSTIWEVDAIQFDFANAHIQQRCDKRGNCVGSTCLISSTMGINPIDLFAWGNDNVLGNTVKDAVLDLSTNTDPSVAGNTVSFLSEVTVLSEEDIWGNVFLNTTADIGATSLVANSLFSQCALTTTGGFLNKATCNDGLINLTDNVTADGVDVGTGSILIGSGNAGVTSALLRERSYLEVSDEVIASGIELWENDTIILSDTVNAINVRAYTGGDITASGSVFIEGVVIQNVSKFNASGTGSMSPAFICNQSTVTIAGDVDMANNYISSSLVGFTDSVRCQNCWFYSVVDTFNGVQLDTFAYSIMNRPTFYKTIDVDTFSLTNGTQGAGKIITDVTGNGKGTWQDPTAYGEMGFGDSTRTIALTDDVWSVVTNTAKDLLSAGATTLHNVTYQGDSLKIDSAGTYQIILNLSVDGTNTSVLKLGVFKNGVIMNGNTGHIELVNNHTVQISYNDIAPLAIGDGLRIVVMNTANNDDVTARNGKITINKLR